ncbi:MAG: hypothetical protein CEE43_14455 [Promethearchaeota archaeon Loki_b32]|nr:MAG: hypothetical protein CEE43_14455 [Candidatus Lokiarchaeota archaeon Loki_b32]
MLSRSRKITLGTKEWADSNVNCYFGCSNNCRYCYAKKMAIRFKRKTEKTWKIMEPNLKAIKKGYLKRKGRIMFPTSHDITMESLSSCLIVLKKIIDAGNEILITTKPRLSCIKLICNDFYKKKNSIQFRFTITSKNNELLKFWEPYAPLFKERIEALKFAYHKGYKTSVSIEPFLDEDPYTLVDILYPYITESIWIGKMNYVFSKNKTPKLINFYNYIDKINSKENLLRIFDMAKNYDNSIVRIKDSIYNFLNKVNLK